MPSQDVNLIFKFRAKGDLESALNRINAALNGTEQTANKSTKTLGASFRTLAKPLQDTLIMFRRIGLYAGIAIAPLALAMNDLNAKLEKSSDVASKLRISLSDASKQMYGFDIASKESVDGQTALNKTWGAASNAMSGLGNNIAIAYGWMAKFATVAFGKSVGATDDQIRKAVKHFSAPNQMSDKLAPVRADMRVGMDKAGMTTLAFQKRQIEAQAQRYLDMGIDKGEVNAWRSSQFVPIEKEKTKEMLKQQGVRLAAEKKTLQALEVSQRIALDEFTDKFGDEGELVNAYIAGQAMIMEETKKTMMGITQFWDETGKGLEGEFKSMFSDAFRGELDSFGDYFESFALSVADAFSGMIAKMMANMIIFGNTMGESGGGGGFGGIGGILGKGIMSMFGGGGGAITGDELMDMTDVFAYHQGGRVRKAHSGYMASDEVPIIAQTGEGILSRRGMSRLGRGNFDRLNQGEGGGGGSVSITIAPVIQAWDATDVYRNRQALVDSVAADIMNNGQLRKIIQRNGK